MPTQGKNEERQTFVYHKHSRRIHRLQIPDIHVLDYDEEKLFTILLRDSDSVCTHRSLSIRITATRVHHFPVCHLLDQQHMDI